MTQQFIVTIPPNSGLGDSPYVAFNKINSNFSDLYSGAPSGIPAAVGSLTGLEVVVVNSAGQPETVTTAQIAALSPNPNQGDPNGTIGGASNFAQNLVWFSGVPQIVGGGALGGNSNLSSGPGWQTGNGVTLQSPAPASGTTYGNSVPLALFATGASANSVNATFPSICNAQSGPGSANLVRLWANGLPLGGFTSVFYFVLPIANAGQQLFLGVANNLYATYSASISSTLNAIGIIKDTGDSVVSFYINNGSGAGTKTATTLTTTAMAGHLFRLVVTCDPLGNCVTTLTDIEPVANLGTFTSSNATATAKLPATGVYVQPVMYVSNGVTAVNVNVGIQYNFTTTSFGGG